MTIDKLTPEAVAALLRRDVKPVFLLGAGASVKSGVPLAGTLVELIGKFAYCKQKDRDPDDPTLMRSDWIRWLHALPWYRSDIPQADLYPTAVARLLRPQAVRKEFFRRILKPGVPISSGYTHLANLMSRRLIKTVLTTNFDDLAVRAVEKLPSIPEIAQIRTRDDLRQFHLNPPHPQLIYLHGSVNHFTDRNDEEETQELDLELVNTLGPLLRYHPLVVVGYRGAEGSPQHPL